MGLLGGSGGGGDDSPIVSIAIFCTIISLVVTIGVALMLPTSGDYDYDTITQERMNVANFTGESMLNTTPWALTGVYTPWMIGSEYNIDSAGFLYGESITSYTYIYDNYHKTTEIKLDPEKKSNVPLSYGEQEGTKQVENREWWADVWGLNGILTTIGLQESSIATVDTTYPTWNYSGYRYTFDPMLPFSSDDGDKVSTVDGELTIVWYSNKQVDGISGGLVIYGRDNVLLAQIESAEIIASYNSMSGFSSKYRFDFDGSDIYLNIRFDPDVITAGTELSEAWSSGAWSLAITSPSAGNYLDITKSTSLSSTLGNIIDTFKQIFTFSLPNLGEGWDIVLWLICSFPAELAYLLLCSRMGIAGIPAAVLGNVLLVS